MPEESADAVRRGGVLRWWWERWTRGVPPNPPPEAFPLGNAMIATPRAAGEELRITWVGQATFLLQLGSVNLLTDPIWSGRASPVPFAGPRRLAPPGIRFAELPPIDGVVISHDHYDHLDDRTVRRIARRFGPEVQWLTPPGYLEWFEKRGIGRVAELSWWEEVELATRGGPLRARSLPAQHWSARGPLGAGPRGWAAWSLEVVGAGRLFFAGDTGYFDGFSEIGRAEGPFDASLLPIGAYEPRWFMRPAHMNPEEAVQAYTDLGADGAFVPMHWGTFRLSDEHPLEAPQRLAEEWDRRRMPRRNLRILRHGETFVSARSSAGQGNSLAEGE